MRTMKRVALAAVIASVIISGALGVAAVLARSWGDLQTRILLTTLTVTGTCLLLLCAAVLHERRGARILPAAGAALAGAGFLLALGIIWDIIRGASAEKAYFIVLSFSVATALLCLLSLAHLPGRYRGFLWLSFLAWYVVASKISLMIAADSESDFDLRVLGVSSIVGGCLAILIPIFHRILSGREATQGGKWESAIHCPACGVRMPSSGGVERCNACGASFSITFTSDGPGERTTPAA